MIKYISFIILVGFVYTNSFFSEFIKSNDIFLNNSLQCINFNYELKNSIQEFPNKGKGSIAIEENKYIIYLDNYIFLFQDSIVKQYNKQTNQIFINASDIYFDSIITQFFSLKYLEKYNKQLSDYIIMPMNLEQDNLFFKVLLDTNRKNISLIEYTDNNLVLSLFNFEFLTKCERPQELFQFNYPNAFILDLRD